jgi:ATP-dependent DNA helicase RecG
VAHRDYFEKGANVMVEMFDDRIEITSPGGLPKGLRPEDFGKKSVLRNPNIANLLHRAGYIEKMGTGINKMRRLMADAGLSPIEFEFGTFFTAIFRRPEKREKVIEGITNVINEAINEAIDDGLIEGINEGIKKRILQEVICLIQKSFITRRVIENLCKISTATAERDIVLLKKMELIKFEGSKKSGRYVLTEKGKKIREEMEK